MEGFEGVPLKAIFHIVESVYMITGNFQKENSIEIYLRNIRDIVNINIRLVPLYNFSSNKIAGFTLIELLIVIAVLSILAIGVIAAIDPLEQYNRGRDATVIRLAADYKKGVDRYYTSRSGQYPTSIATGYSGSIAQGAGSPAGAGYNSVTELQGAGELKTTITSGSIPSLTSVILTMPNGGPPIACTILYSRSFRGNTSAIYNTSGVTQGGCPNAASSNCSICFF